MKLEDNFSHYYYYHTDWASQKDMLRIMMLCHYGRSKSLASLHNFARLKYFIDNNLTKKDE